jgi:hypothetical protein
MKKVILGFALALAAWAAFSNAAMADKFVIDAEVWAHYQGYLKAIGNIRPGAYAITKDGHGAFYVWCEETRCMAGPSYGQDAVSRREHEYNTDCVVFAVRDEIKVEYEVVASAASNSAPSAAPKVNTAPATTITVSSDVKADIDAYLRNASSAARVWALAIAKDGSSVESASCPSSGWTEGEACNPQNSTLQEQANRRAMKKCGDPDDCILLYVGQKKAATVDVVGSDGIALGVYNAPQVATAPATTVPNKSVETPSPQKSADPVPSTPTAVASADPVTPPKPSLKIAVSSALQSDIDSYLRNAHSTARLWAFAIAKDGSDGAMASCPAGGSWSGGGACEPVKGGPQELANSEALKRCGGSDDCILLYVGEKKTADVEIVDQ